MLLQFGDNVMEAITDGRVEINQLRVDVGDDRMLGLQVEEERSITEERFHVLLVSRRYAQSQLGKQLRLSVGPFQDWPRWGGSATRQGHRRFSRSSESLHGTNRLALGVSQHRSVKAAGQVVRIGSEVMSWDGLLPQVNFRACFEPTRTASSMSAREGAVAACSSSLVPVSWGNGASAVRVREALTVRSFPRTLKVVPGSVDPDTSLLGKPSGAILPGAADTSGGGISVRPVRSRTGAGLVDSVPSLSLGKTPRAVVAWSRVCLLGLQESEKFAKALHEAETWVKGTRLAGAIRPGGVFFVAWRCILIAPQSVIPMGAPDREARWRRRCIQGYR